MLILGSLPGKVSLERNEYYAQPYNAFWRIMGELVGASPDLLYQNRLECLKHHHIAVWDVCAAGFRAGSLDSAIQLSTVRANDVGTLAKSKEYEPCPGSSRQGTSECPCQRPDTGITTRSVAQ